MNAEDFVSKLEEKLGLRPLAFSSEGVISFTFNEKFTAHIEKSSDGKLLMVYAEIGELPKEDREACLLALLEANLFGQKTQGSSFGIDSDTSIIYLFRAFEFEEHSFDAFYQGLTGLLQTQVEWTKNLEAKAYLPPPKNKSPSIYL